MNNIVYLLLDLVAFLIIVALVWLIMRYVRWLNRPVATTGTVRLEFHEEKANKKATG